MKISSAEDIVCRAEMSDERADKLRSYPEPTNRKELAAWVGLAAQCNSWFPEVNQASYKMRQLLKKDREFVWLEEMSSEFQEMKRVLCSKIVLSSFNQNYETRLLVDSSIKFGVAYLLLQIREAITEEKQLFYGHLPQGGGGGLTNSGESECVWKLLTYHIWC